MESMHTNLLKTAFSVKDRRTKTIRWSEGGKCWFHLVAGYICSVWGGETAPSGPWVASSRNGIEVTVIDHPKGGGGVLYFGSTWLTQILKKAVGINIKKGGGNLTIFPGKNSHSKQERTNRRRELS